MTLLGPEPPCPGEQNILVSFPGPAVVCPCCGALSNIVNLSEPLIPGPGSEDGDTSGPLWLPGPRGQLGQGKASPLQVPAPSRPERRSSKPPWDRLPRDQFQSMIWKISQSHTARPGAFVFLQVLLGCLCLIIWPSKEILVLPTEGNMGADKGLYTKGLRTVDARMTWGSLEARPSRTGESLGSSSLTRAGHQSRREI